MELLDSYTKWRWHDLERNIWNGFGRLIQHTFPVLHEHSRYKQNIRRSYIPYLCPKSL